MSDYHYKKHIDNGTTYDEGSMIQCHDADISAVGTFIPAPTFTAAGFECDTSAKVVSDGSATVDIGRLFAQTVDLTVTSSGYLHIGVIEASNVTIKIENSGKLIIDSGKIGVIGGVVKNSSYGKCTATIKQDNVTVESASTWVTS